jgi:maltose-binding protein MalE
MAAAPDLLSLLMLQNGTTMVSSDLSTARFAGDSTSPGLSAFNFYLQFANAASPYYTWNDAMGSDLQSFVNGNAAIMFGYHADLATIKTKAPFLNIGIAAVPQAKGATISVSYPKYSGFAVYKGSASVLGAWNFILSLTTIANSEKIYTDAAGVPPALRTAISTVINDPNMSVFAKQSLTARSWYEVDDEKVESIFNGAIQDVLNGVTNSATALDQAQSAVSSLMFQHQH